MKPEEIFEQVSLFLPKYLTPTQKQELQSLFLNANTLSVDDLLKLVYERMEQRPS